MKQGWLIVNAYLKSEKFQEIYNYLVEAAVRKNCGLKIITNEEILTELPELKTEKPDFAIFWDKDIKAAKYMEKNNIRVFNSSQAIEICDDKALTYLALMDTEINMPKTIIAPLTFGLQTNLENFLNNAIKKVKLPFILKENCGSFGAQVHMVRTKEEAKDIIESIHGRGFIIQEYIDTSYGKDIRIHMVGEQPVAVMLRENKNDFRANVTNGGSMFPYEPDEKQIKMARQVCSNLGLDFAGVDIMFGESGEPVFCEVNSNAHFKNIYDCTGVNVADYILDYVLENI